MGLQLAQRGGPLCFREWYLWCLHWRPPCTPPSGQSARVCVSARARGLEGAADPPLTVCAQCVLWVAFLFGGWGGGHAEETAYVQSLLQKTAEALLVY